MDRNTKEVPMADYIELLESTIERDPAYWDRPNVEGAKCFVLGMMMAIESMGDNEADAVENLLLLSLRHSPRFQRL